ncbi:hypothetical protein BD289DRAFT_483933 [Coniella lustricola]|uniref:Uncharacterized protein n=1 Tax=Coniella lustricola TaxID=2025994 RepID=A0A2T3A3U6_9PEZI|nr:hypothetical protein BD289DRAFT_483933 [Coniella lustricola]
MSSGPAPSPVLDHTSRLLRIRAHIESACRLTEALHTAQGNSLECIHASVPRAHEVLLTRTSSSSPLQAPIEFSNTSTTTTGRPSPLWEPNSVAFPGHPAFSNGSMGMSTLLGGDSPIPVANLPQQEMNLAQDPSSPVHEQHRFWAGNNASPIKNMMRPAVVLESPASEIEPATPLPISAALPRGKQSSPVYKPSHQSGASASPEYSPAPPSRGPRSLVYVPWSPHHDPGSPLSPRDLTSYVISPEYIPWTPAYEPGSPAHIPHQPRDIEAPEPALQALAPLVQDGATFDDFVRSVSIEGHGPMSALGSLSHFQWNRNSPARNMKMEKCCGTEQENHIGHSIETESVLLVDPEALHHPESVSVTENVILETEIATIAHARLPSPATAMSQADLPGVAHAVLIGTEDRTVHATMAVRAGGEETTAVDGLGAPSGVYLPFPEEAHAGRQTVIRRL